MSREDKPTYAIKAPESQWISDEDINALRAECAVFFPDETPEETTNRKLREAAPVAALRLAHLAAHGEGPVAVKAAQVILEYTIGSKKAAAKETSPAALAQQLMEKARAVATAKPWQN